MVLSVAWLDTSPEEQRRTREVLRLFEQHESRDELGIGQVRDVLSDAMFPGFSVLHTRARYYFSSPGASNLQSVVEVNSASPGM